MASPAIEALSASLQQFWRWWSGELKVLVPTKITQKMAQSNVLPLIVIDAHHDLSAAGTDATMPDKTTLDLYRFDGMRWLKSLSIPGDTHDDRVRRLGLELRNAKVSRVAVALDEDFRSGLDGWTSRGNATAAWSFSRRPMPGRLTQPIDARTLPLMIHRSPLLPSAGSSSQNPRILRALEK